MVAEGKAVTDFEFDRFHVDLDKREVRRERVRCADVEDVLGGIARGFKLLEDRPVADAYDPAAALVMNLGILSGTEFMTGLRTFFHAYSPLKASRKGAPAAMWTAGSGKFGTKLRALGVDEVVFTGRASEPVLLHITPGPEFAFEPAADLAGRRVNAKIQALHGRYPEAHFAVLGPAGENYGTVRYAAIALSTENQLKTGDAKPRFCGRGGIGGVMGSKNLLAIAADGPDRKSPKTPALVEINKIVARGKGSQRYRDPDKENGLGGTWSVYEMLNPIHAMPENNFAPTGTDASLPLHRPKVEEGPWVVKDESCYRCGIKCHKNVYEQADGGQAGRFRAKLDYEPLNMLSSNIGIFDIDRALTLVELVDELGMDSISCGVTLAYAMEWNRRHPDAPIADGLAFGDADACERAIEAIAAGELELLGQGTLRLAQHTGEEAYAMHCKGVEFPAYLPHTNPGYPFALAGGHMSMATYLLLVFEKETGQDYWVKAITDRGIRTMRDDIVGICKFSGMPSDKVAEAIEALNGLAVTKGDLAEATVRTYLRGYRIERRQGFTEADYDLPADAHLHLEQIELPYFNTKEYFDELKAKVLERFDEMAESRFAAQP